MNKMWISTLMVALLAMAGTAQADDDRRGFPPGIQKQMDQGTMLAHGPQRKFIGSKWRSEHRYDRRYDRGGYRHKHRGHDGWKHGHRYDKGRHGGWHKPRYDRHRYKYDKRYHYRSGIRIELGFDDHIPPEYRVARIIRDTQAIIDYNRR